MLLLQQHPTKIVETATFRTLDGVFTIKGTKGDKGDSYTLTSNDKSEIAHIIRTEMGTDVISIMPDSDIDDTLEEVFQLNINTL